MPKDYSNVSQLKTAKGKESGGTTRPHEQFGCAYDAAWNLHHRTNNGLVQTFGVNSLNELTTLSRDGTMTVAGAVSTTPTSVTVKDNTNPAETATVFVDKTFARTNVTLLNGNNTFTPVAQDSYSRSDTNTVTCYLPSSSSCSYDTRRGVSSEHFHRLAIEPQAPASPDVRFTYDALDQFKTMVNAAEIHPVR